MPINDDVIGNLLTVRELQYAVAVGVVAVLVLLLLRHRPTAGTLALFLGGALVTLVAAGLLEGALTVVNTAVAAGSTVGVGAHFWRALIVGGLAAVIGVTLMARAWRDSPERQP